MEYAWKKGFPWGNKADPTAVAERINDLAIDGKFPTARDVLEDGRNVSAPQHPIFEWSDDKAAEQYRLTQANDILRSLVIIKTTKEETQPIRAFVHVVPPNQNEPAYVNTFIAMKDKDMKKQVIEQALNEINLWKQKYARYTEFAKIVDAIEQTMQTRHKTSDGQEN